jgi:predicted transcriptional regulator
MANEQEDDQQPVARTEAELGAMMAASVPKWARPKKTKSTPTGKAGTRADEILSKCDKWTTVADVHEAIGKTIEKRTVHDYLTRLVNNKLLDRREREFNGNIKHEYRKGTGKVKVKTKTDIMLERDERIISMLDGWTRTREIADAIGFSTSTVTDSLNRSIRNGRVKKEMRRIAKCAIPMYRRVE